VCALALTLSLPLLSAAATTGISPLIATMEFSVGPAQLGSPIGPPFGLPGSYVAAEQVGPFVPVVGAADSADDDIYRAELTLPAPLPFSNGKIVDDGFPPNLTVGTGLINVPPGIPVPPPFPPPPGLMAPPPSCTIPGEGENVDALATESVTVDMPSSAEQVRTALLSGLLHAQFSVDNASLGLAGSGVDTQASAVTPEHPGDVYEAVPATPVGTNVVIADEDAAGLAVGVPPQDDLDALVLQQSIFDFFPGIGEDTDGVGGPDTPLFFFSTDKPYLNTFGTPIAPSDLLFPGPVGIQPAVALPSPALGLTPADNLDALFVDFDGDILFSLDRPSPSLAPAATAIVNLPLGGFGADPGDLIFVTPFASSPTVVLTANEIGLQGSLTADPTSDELNALWVTDETLEAPLEIPVGLSLFSGD
jgi:hypothetical protein